MTPIEWRIDTHRVGPAELGKPLPEALAGDLDSHYAARLIADARPVDTFVFDDPPLVAIVDGPFAKSDGNPQGATDRLRAAAVAAARGGATIVGLMITGSGPRTATGLGVGSTFAELQAAYSDFRLSAIPPTLGHDECIGKTPQLPGVAFVFPTCAKAKSGTPVARIDVSAE